MTSPETLSEYRKKMMRKRLMDFMLQNLLPDYIDYAILDDIKTFVNNETEEYGSEISAFCEYFGLGRWFETKMEDCDFEIEDFFAEYAKEIEWRAAE